MGEIKELDVLATQDILNKISTKTNWILKRMPVYIHDKVTILSQEDIVKTSQYIFQAINTPTDYAKTCGCIPEKKQPIFTQNDICLTPTRDPSDTIENSYIASNSGRTETLNIGNSTIGIRPVIAINLEHENIDLEKLKNKITYISKDTPNIKKISFGSFPRSKVSQPLETTLNSYYNFKKLTLVPDKTYPSFVDTQNNQTYEYDGKLYVRSKLNHKTTSFIKYNDGTKINCQSPLNLYVWHLVEPIEWGILNWDDLPKTINPKGRGTAKTMQLITLEAIMGGFPYNDHIHSTNNQYYQNSLLRAFLNDYDLTNEIEQNYNGNPEFISSYRHDFSPNSIQKKSFINSAFNNELDFVKEQQKSQVEQLVQHINRKSNKIKITNKPMSIEEQINFYYNNRLSFMLHGKSGIGKSRRVAELDPEYFLLTLRNGMMPEEIIGKECPNPNAAGTQWYAPSWYYELCKKCENEPKKNHILFIDELTNVNEYEQSLVYHLVLNRSIGIAKGKLPENCVVVAAGNSKEESNSAYNMSEPLFRRFHGHIYLPLDIESFLEWGSEPRKENPEEYNIHPLISRFLSAYPNILYSEYDPEKSGENFAVDPRAWEQISDVIYKNNEEISRELLRNKIGENYTSMLTSFAEKDFITIDEILNDSYNKAIIPTKLDEQYALALSLRSAKENEIEKVRTFIADNLSGETLAKFDFIWINNNPERALIISELQKNYSMENKTETSTTEQNNPENTLSLI